MSYQILCKCDGCGAEFLDPDSVLEISVTDKWRYRKNVVVGMSTNTLHFCNADCLREFTIKLLEEVDACLRKS